MGRFAGLLIADTHRRLVFFVLWAVLFTALLAGSGWFLADQVHANLRAEVDRAMVSYTRVRTAVLNTFDAMDEQLTAVPCSREYTMQQRRIAFLPDGINELFYARNGAIVCSGNGGMLPVPVALGEPDLASNDRFGISFWFNKDLDFMGLDNAQGTIALRGEHGMVVPRTPLPDTIPRWLSVEVVLRAPGGKWWHISGEPGLYAASLVAPPAGPFGLRGGAFLQTACDEIGLHCLSARATLANLFALGGMILGLTLLVCVVLSAWLARYLRAMLARYWSFEARFLRNFRAERVVCAYQPLLDLRRDRIAGCEVLARWRDVDGTMVFPDQFLTIVEKNGLTAAFTRMVINRALAELSSLPPSSRALQVNLNIFPRDLDGALLVEMLGGFLALADRFAVVIELVETSEVERGSALAAIEALWQAGIATYIDDFGSGYSSIHTLAELPVAGVKLDRSFAMAPDGSVMGQMLGHAIDMAHAAGRTLVVEGVETAARLDMLRQGGRVDLAQGYHIARPLDFDHFARFIAERGPTPQRSRPTLVA
jgi:sensor c-di-GMP phosphodiesterase-like protein